MISHEQSVCMLNYVMFHFYIYIPPAWIGPSIVGGIHWTRDESVDSDSESEDEIGSIGPPPTDASSRYVYTCIP